MILDALYVLFKGDTSDLKKSEKEAEGITKDFTKALGTANLASEHLGSSLSNVVSQMAAYAASLISAGSIIYGIKQAAQYSEELYNNARALNLNAETLGIWENAVTKAGGSAAGFDSTIAHLSSHFNITQAGVLKSLPQIANLFSKLSNFRAQKLAGMLGIDQGTLYLLQKGSSGIQEAIKHQKELGVVTEKDTKIAHAFYQEWGDMKQAFRSFFVMLASDVLPTLSKVVHGFTEFAIFMRTHKELLIGGIVGIAAVTTALLIPSLYKAAQAIFALELTGAPLIIALVAIGAAIALAVEDFLIYKKGGDSVTGAIVNWTNAHPKLIGLINDIAAAAKFAAHALEDLAEAFGIVDAKNKKNKESIFTLAGFQEYTHKLSQAQVQLDTATNNTFTSTPANGLASKILNTKSLEVNIANITIETQATDNAELAKDLGINLQTQLEQALHTFSTGQII